jgi:hypothetical protein
MIHMDQLIQTDYLIHWINLIRLANTITLKD